jgi:hypothetical protein
MPVMGVSFATVSRVNSPYITPTSSYVLVAISVGALACNLTRSIFGFRA